MTLTLELGPEAEEKLRRKADRHSQKLNDYALTVLLTDAEDELPAPGESLADVFAGQTGGFHSRGAGKTSQNTGAAFAELLLEQKHRGKI